MAALLPLGAAAQPAVKPAQAAAGTTAAPVETTTVPVLPAVSVSGFRAARFGMTEAQVRAAAASDFPQSFAAAKTSTNAVEKTSLITLKVADLLPNGGEAEISYIFGYKTKTLIQVSVVWSRAFDEKNGAEQLFADGEILKSNFMSQNYDKDSVLINRQLGNRIILFRGEDGNKRTTVLYLDGIAKKELDNTVFIPTDLRLFYILNAKDPDIFKLDPGKF